MDTPDRAPEEGRSSFGSVEEEGQEREGWRRRVAHRAYTWQEWISMMEMHELKRKEDLNV